MRNRESVSALSAGAYTTTLLVMVDRVKERQKEVAIATLCTLWDTPSCCFCDIYIVLCLLLCLILYINGAGDDVYSTVYTL
jgi:hypothetical protein